MANRWGNNAVRDFILGAPKSLQMVIAAMKLKNKTKQKNTNKTKQQQQQQKKTLVPWKESYDQPRQHIKKQRHHFANKSLYCQSYGFPVVMYGCDSWTIKKAEC